MPRPYWSGHIQISLVSVGVKLFVATESKSEIRFHQISRSTGERVRHQKVLSSAVEEAPNEAAAPIEKDEIVKGYEYAKNKFVIITDEDFKTAAVEASKTLEIVDFVKEDEIDPRYFETPYFLVPSKGGEKAYALLREAIRKTGMVGIGKIIMRQKQHLAGIRVVEDALILEIMRFANELIDPDTLNLPNESLVRPQELNMAEQLVSSLAESFDPTKYTDEYRANLMRLIHGKMKGKKVNLKPDTGPERDTQVIDLMTRLRESLEGGKKRGAVRSTPHDAAARERKTASKSRTAKTARRARRKTA